MRTGKKWLAAVLSLVMALTMMPLTAAAAEGSNDEDTYTVAMYRLVYTDEGEWDSDSDFVKGYDPESYMMKDTFKIPSVRDAGSEIRMEVLKNGEVMDPDDYYINGIPMKQCFL